jgi:hypothetical protein
MGLKFEFAHPLFLRLQSKIPQISLLAKHQWQRPKTTLETKAKRRKKNVQFPNISHEKHQASPSLNDVSYFLCRTFLSMLQ